MGIPTMNTHNLFTSGLRWLGVLCAMAAVVACSPAGGSLIIPPPAEPVSLVLASHNSFNISEDVLTEFEEANNADVVYLALGDAGETLNKLILSKDAPLADVVFGVDNTFLSRALANDLFIPHESSLLDGIADELKLDPEFGLLPVDFGYINLNADKAWFADRGLALPERLEDLTKPEYAGLLVVQNPATSSPGLAFLLATVSYFGEPAWLDFWSGLLANDVLVTGGWSEAYFDHFTVGSGGAGSRPLVVSYSTSPPADVLYASDGRTEPASVNLNLPLATFRQIEFVGVLHGTQHPDLAKAFVDFMLDVRFQEDIPLNMFVYPVNQAAGLPDLFEQFAEVPADPAPMAPEDIDAHRRRWIEEWTSVMLN